MIKNNLHLSSGQILLSEPFMLDPNFKRTVVLLCEHEDEGESVGFILNRTLNIKVCDALVNFDSVDNELFYGGPVAQDTLHYLHKCGDLVEDSMHIVDDIYWGGNFEQITNMINAGTISSHEIKFFLGYSGWGIGQLQDELKESSWILAQAKNKYIFETKEKELWKEILTDLGGDYKLITNYPENPILN